MKKETKDAIRLLAMASTMGLSLALAVFIGYGIGYYLDKWFDTKPWLTYIFLVFGIVAGFKNIWVIGKRLQEMEKQDK